MPFPDEAPSNPTLFGFVAVGAACGIAAHLGLFIRGEWHVQAPWIGVWHLSVVFCLTFAEHFARRLGILLAPMTYVCPILIGGYLLGFFGSITIYRLFFHPLIKAGFRGPRYACTTKLWHVWKCRDSRNHILLDEIHKQYGDFVRTGPNELTVFRPEIFMATDGPHSDCIKSDWYDLLLPNAALVTIREKGGTKALRRRQWNHAFSPKALEHYIRRILCHLEELYQCISTDANSGQVTDVRDIFLWYSFDAMGDFVFGKPFGMQKGSDSRVIAVRLERALSLLGPLSPAPWLIQIGFKLAPRVLHLKDWFDMTAWCRGMMRDRIADQSRHGQKDLTQYIMEGDGGKITDETLRWLNEDSLLTIVAGSGPIASTLTGLFTEIGKKPEILDRLYEEIKDVDCADARALANMSYLTACIEETLRLYPALLTGGSRMTTGKGMTVAGRWIPPNTKIVAPRHIISRRDDCFVRPQEFVPERWTTAPEMVLNASASKPFGTGHTSCIGRPLALVALRLAVAGIAKRYKARFAPNENGRGMNQDLRDHFVLHPGGLRMCFESRD